MQSSEKTKLMSVGELAKGITYTEPLFTGWKPPLPFRRLSKRKFDHIRNQFHVTVDGEDVPPPLQTFEDMRLPQPLLNKLAAKGISNPSPIQMQGLPVVLSGRDMIGIASTGSGKTFVFILPLIMAALQEEIMMPFVSGEGPFGLVICPSRELADQTYQLLEEFSVTMRKVGYPELRLLLCIGGVDMKLQRDGVKKGVHIVVATPGRLKDVLAKKILNLDNCSFLTLDEADRLVDHEFEQDIREILSYFKAQRQTLLFSATMPTQVQEFVKTALVKPVTVHIGRPGAANANIRQRIRYVTQQDKKNYLPRYVKKTEPPVLIFCKDKAEVDDLHFFLLARGVDAAGIHGGMDQEERAYAISSFKSGKKDVLVATDVASKGLDFPDIKHVINYDMPAELENYVHRIGRTGRRGKKGRATTFINNSQSEATLVDLKRLLQESKQKIPSVLADLTENGDTNCSINEEFRGCHYCGGLGHSISNCYKWVRQSSQQISNSRSNYFSGGGSLAEM